MSSGPLVFYTALVMCKGEGSGVMWDIRSSTALYTLAQFLRPVVLVQEIMRDLLQISQMAVQQRASDGQKVRMPWIVNLDDAPRVLPRAYSAAANFNDLVGADDSERHQAAKFRVLFDGVLVVFFNVVGEVVDRDAVVFDIFHDELFGFGELGWGEGVGFANDGDDIDAGRESSHELNVEFPEAANALLV